MNFLRGHQRESSNSEMRFCPLVFTVLFGCVKEEFINTQ